MKHIYCMPNIWSGYKGMAEYHKQYAYSFCYINRFVATVCEIRVHCSDDMTVLTILAGFPTATQYGGISLVTTEFAPTIAPVPIFTFGKMVALSPIHTLSPITTEPLEYSTRFVGGVFKSFGQLIP